MVETKLEKGAAVVSAAFIWAAVIVYMTADLFLEPTERGLNTTPAEAVRKVDSLAGLPLQPRLK